MVWFSNLSPLIQAFIASFFTFFVTALGSAAVCFFKNVSGRLLSIILGFSAGVMLASSFWSLLAPAIELSSSLGYVIWLFPLLGFVCGGVFVLLADKFLDKITKNSFNLEKKNSLKRSILLVGAITIHNIPEDCSCYVSQ